MDRGPNAFIYKILVNDLTNLTYIGPLIDIPVGLRRPLLWTGDFGSNWECVNFMTLHNWSERCEVMLMKKRNKANRCRSTSDVCSVDGWLVEADGGWCVMEPEICGMLDNANIHVVNWYEHPDTGARVVWG